MNAASNRGKSLTAPFHRGGGRHHNSIIATTTASTAPNPSSSKSFVRSDIQNSFGFALPRNHSVKSRLLTSAPTVVATNSVAHSKLAKASDRAGVSGQL